MDFQNQKKYNVIFKDRKAVLTGYNDQICLLFDKKDGVLDLGDIKVLDNYPEGSYCVFFSSLSMEERKQITLDNGDPLFKDCECSLIFDDKPNSDLLKDYIEITDDTIEYYVPDLLFDPSKYATVKCKNCGKKYKVNRKMGYRSSFFEWNDIASAKDSEKSVTKKEEVIQPTVKAPSALKKDRTIWQWERYAKVRYPKQTKVTFFSLCLVFLASLIISTILMFCFDPRSVISIVSYCVSVFSLIALAVTAGSFKSHNTWQHVFIKDENGDVYYIDYTDAKLANDLHFYGLIPSPYKTGPKAFHSQPLQVAGALYYIFVFPKECKQCLNMIRDNKVDIRVADACHQYGHKIVSVHEIKKKSYYTFIRFKVLRNGKEFEIENLFDNCFEGYDEMVEYLDKHFDHDDPFMREKKLDSTRRLIFIGIGIFLLSAVLLVINSMLKILIIGVAGFVGVLLGIGFIAAYFSEKSKR